MTCEDLARAVIIDVRSAEEVAERHVPDVRHIPGEELAARLHEIPRGTPIVTGCTKGGSRSQAAATLLRQAGFDAVALEGGTLRHFVGSPDGTG